MSGDVIEVEVTLGGQKRVIVARRSGRLTVKRIGCVRGDVVQVEISPYDLTRGRIVYRGVRN